MKLASFRADGKDRVGVRVGDALADLNEVIDQAGLGSRFHFESMLDMIECTQEERDSIHAAVGAFTKSKSAQSFFPFDQVHWYAPVRQPSKICCVALNNNANAERIIAGPKHPAIFIKPSSALIGHLESIVCKPHYGRTHPEPELAVVIGRRVKDVSVAEAYDQVFGYTIHNDVTSPTMRAEDTFHYRAIHPVEGDPEATNYVDTWVSYPGRYKGADTFASMGPWLVTADEIPEPHNLKITCTHRGRAITSDNTKNLLYTIPEVISFLSGYMTLLPGDVISMGTALSKADAGSAVQNVDLNRAGGPVSVSIDRIGELTNSVRTET